MSDDKKLALYLHEGHMNATVDIGDGVYVPDVFTARCRLDTGTIVEIEIAAEPGRARATEVRVSEVQGRGITGLTIDGTRLHQLMRRATQTMAFISTPPSGARHEAFKSDVGRERQAAGRAVRKRVSDARLSKVAEIIDNGGDVEDVMAAEHVGRRQAFRLIARAKEVPK